MLVTAVTVPVFTLAGIPPCRNGACVYLGWHPPLTDL